MYLEDLFEARQVHSEIEYKEKKVKGILDRVIAILTGNKSGSFTRLAQRYKRLDRLTKLMKMERDKLNLETKLKVKDLFDAEDEILTRVIDTASLTITLSKEQTQTIENIDIDAYVEELEQLMPGLEDQIAALRAKYTTVDTIERSESLRVRVKDPEEIKIAKKKKTKESEDIDLNESKLDQLVSRLSNWAHKVFMSVSQWATKYDAQLQGIRSRMVDDGIQF